MDAAVIGLAAFGIIAASVGAVFLKETWKGHPDDVAVTLLAGIVLVGVGIWVLTLLTFRR